MPLVSTTVTTSRPAQRAHRRLGQVRRLEADGADQVRLSGADGAQVPRQRVVASSRPPAKLKALVSQKGLVRSSRKVRQVCMRPTEVPR